MKQTILAIDNDHLVLTSIKMLFADADIEVETASSGELGIALFREQPNRFSVVLLDFEMKTKEGHGMDGDEVAVALKAIQSEVRIVMVSGVEDQEIIDKCLKAGAEKFLRKGKDPSPLISLITSMLPKGAEDGKERSDIEREQKIRHVLKMVGRSREFCEVADFVEKIAPFDEPALILGESGVGKEGIAGAVHENSRRKGKPFVAINCAAFSKELLESELFGHERGAFTGALNKKIGLFEAADGGTIFLDEIGDMPLDLQAKILRALQEKKIQPVGALAPRKVDFRVVAATHRNLREAAEKGTFRQDLYYRLKYLTIEVVPLRERPEDIEPLVFHFINEMEKKHGTRKTITHGALRKLKSHCWTGNVRELEAVVKKAFVMSDGRITPQAFMDEIAEIRSNNIEAVLASGEIIKYDEFRKRVEEQERTLLKRAMELAKNVKSDAAALLGMNHNTMNYRRSVLKIEEGKTLTGKAASQSNSFRELK
ncbi:MAG: sigma-54-dependent Fis family transcriptional regulator [Bdellovibrionaceae bacterium]|nr:sigma-54-dependent Fis family transcriptional regulator [Pseudobdellovibrionaceae bacterium]